MLGVAVIIRIVLCFIILSGNLGVPFVAWSTPGQLELE